MPMRRTRVADVDPAERARLPVFGFVVPLTASATMLGWKVCGSLEAMAYHAECNEC